MMRRSAPLLFFMLFFTGLALGQRKNIGQFAVWKPKEGKASAFEEGFEPHLNWHKENGDKWNWYSWYVVSGERFGLFIDGTFDLAWSDFDHPVDPIADMADNQKNVAQYADLKNLYKVVNVQEYSTKNTFDYTLGIARLLTVKVYDTPELDRLLKALYEVYIQKGVKSFKTFKTVDAGNLNEVIIFLGFSNWQEYGASENILREISAIEQKMSGKVVKDITSETLAFESEMSYFGSGDGKE
ncbi:hypothetical protein H8S90_05665 [Olivibacter sp. SDN3]|uniref:hypothetical protein n=1 Tax=Olivibacter sp. SDN3 TaxID=2764720 RepID=UPI001650E507|nr:hypothetical protein [Olivibacter sp. SDN3]QNL51074.1 hypothetical protein H8S90_05665 [Olivibacter sp. SDN3]